MWATSISDEVELKMNREKQISQIDFNVEASEAAMSDF